MKRQNYFFRALAALMIAVILAIPLSACVLSADFVRTLEFTEAKIDLMLGDEIDLYDHIKIEPQNSYSEIRIVSADENIVSSNTALTLKALSVGKSHVKAIAGGKEATTSVEVFYREIEGIQLFAYGDLFQDRNATSSIDFVAVVDEYVEPNYRICWYVDDNKQTIEGKNFIYSPPTTPGVYKVSAVIDDTTIMDSLEIIVYEQYAITPTIEVLSGEDGIEFHPSINGYWEWYVFGESVQAGFGEGSFSFNPSKAGIYLITARQYNKPIMIEGVYEYQINVGESITPTALSFDYDNCYPNSYISWQLENVVNSQGFVFYVDIEGTDGSLKSYSSDQNPELFEGMRFDSSGIIDVAKSYKISVSCAKEDEFQRGEECSIQTQAVSSSAIQYLSQKCLDANYYVTSDEEFYSVYEYTLWMRANSTTKKGKTSSSLSVYMGYTSEKSANKLSRYAWARAAQSGLFYLNAPEGEPIKGEVLSIKITYASDNTPSKNTEYDHVNSSLLHPHFEYSGNTNRKLPIEDRPLSDDIITNSNELYYIVEKGYRPNVKADSDAEELYNYAIKVLRQIITDEMDELEKIHTIYDWVLWRTHFDKKVESVTSLEESVKYTSYYLESVLTDKFPFSVCDGLSKTYSLLANMEGITCVRAVGKAESGSNKWGEHAWNKVLYEGEWYIVDCTWGDYEVQMGTTVFETASHQYLMLSSGDISSTHRENAFGGYPATAKKPFLYFRREFTHNGATANLFFSEQKTIIINAQVEALVDYVLALRPTASTYSFGSGKYSQSTVEYYGTDFFVVDYLTNKIINAIANKLEEKGITDYIVTPVGNGGYMYVLIKFEQ